MEDKTVFELNESLEKCTHIKVTKLMDETDKSKVIGDLGVIEKDEEGIETFVSKYGNAVVERSNIKDFIDPFEN